MFLSMNRHKEINHSLVVERGVIERYMISMVSHCPCTHNLNGYRAIQSSPEPVYSALILILRPRRNRLANRKGSSMKTCDGLLIECVQPFYMGFNIVLGVNNVVINCKNISFLYERCHFEFANICEVFFWRTMDFDAFVIRERRRGFRLIYMD